MGIAIVAIAGSLFLVRKQAIKDGETFWSPPLRRVAQAMFPPLLVGVIFGFVAWAGEDAATFLLVLWPVLFGLALLAASFFLPSGIRLFGWWFMLTGAAMMLCLLTQKAVFETEGFAHLFMAIVFGLSHLAYGTYLYSTERKNAA